MEETTKVYTQNFDLLFPEVPVQINRESCTHLAPSKSRILQTMCQGRYARPSHRV